MPTFYMLLLILIPNIGSVLAREYEEEHEPLFYHCPDGHVLTVYNRSSEHTYTITQCSPPVICGKPMTCVPSTGKACIPRFSYLTGVDEMDEGNILSSCCQVTPDSHAEEFCYSIDYLNRHYPVNEFEEYPDDGEDAVVHTTKHPPVNHPPHKPGNHKRHHSTEKEKQVDEVVVPAGLMLFDVSDRRATYEFVKGICKTRNGYQMTVCTAQCRSTSTVTTRKPTTPKLTTHITPPTPTAKPVEDVPKKKGIFGKLGSGHGCFSGDMTVMTPDGLKRMDQMKTGDHVQVIAQDSSTNFQPIEWFYHRDPDHKMAFINVRTKSGHHVSLTSNHLIPFVPCIPELITPLQMDTFILKAQFVSKSKVGMCLAVKQGINMMADPIVAIWMEEKEGVYSPITPKGTLLVNGIQVSCYSSFENQLIQHAVHSMLIKIDQTIQAIGRLIRDDLDTGKREDTGIPLILSFLLHFAKQVLPSHVFL